MGTWSEEIFGDDVALDIREAFLERLATGEDAERATREVLKDLGDQFDDFDDGPILWMALAATQWEYGCLQPKVKEHALEAIGAKGVLERWSGPERAKREKALVALAKTLGSTQPKPKRPRRKERVEVPKHQAPGPDGLTMATAFEIDGYGQVMVEMGQHGTRGGGGVFAGRMRHQDIELEWLDADTLQITYPASAVPDRRDEKAFYCGRTVRCVYRTR